MLKVGDKIRIIEMYGDKEFKVYKGLEGVITRHPYKSVYFGTWGDLPLFAAFDKFEKVKADD